ncbi:alpha/beta hydrolase, partial [candidate division KSB1 bacterium]|nr:alpha/beta hydrolase [candidate division KSB1 bacterium]
PLLIVTGNSDQITPPGMAEKLYDKAAAGDKELVIIENGGHNDLPQRNEYTTALRRFYQEILK